MYADAVKAWLQGQPPPLPEPAPPPPYTFADSLANCTVLHEGPLNTVSTTVTERDLWWVRRPSGEVVACVCFAPKVTPLTVRQQELLWSERLETVRRDPLWQNERVLPNGQVVPEIPLAFVARREDRSERADRRRESRSAVARSQVDRLNHALWHTNRDCLPTDAEMAQTSVLWPESLRRSVPDRLPPAGQLACQVRADPRQAALLDARAARLRRMTAEELSKDPHAATVVAMWSIYHTV